MFLSSKVPFCIIDDHQLVSLLLPISLESFLGGAIGKAFAGLSSSSSFGKSNEGRSDETMKDLMSV